MRYGVRVHVFKVWSPYEQRVIVSKSLVFYDDSMVKRKFEKALGDAVGEPKEV